MRIQPARIEWREDGTPCSPEFGDVYHSAAGGLAQARHVFVQGNGLPTAWQGRERYVILETGFGLGTNFLATWGAWRADPQACARLFYLAVDKHPPCVEDLRRMHGGHELTALGAELAAQWPLPAPGLHVLEFEAGKVVLMLGWGEVESMVAELSARVDAIYLDGFAPARNAQMWSPQVMRAVARLAHSGTRLATYTAAAAVREALGAAGFVVERAAGFAGKRDMTVGHYAATNTRRPVKPSSSAFGLNSPTSPAHAAQAPKNAIVIGAGVAGCATASALAQRGVEVVLIDGAHDLATATSSNRMGALQPALARDDSRWARWTRAGFFDAMRRLHGLRAEASDIAELAGLLHLAMDDAEENSMRELIANAGLPEAYVRWLSREEASRAAGVEVGHGGWWFAQGGWVRPARYARALVDAQCARIRLCLDTTIATIAPTSDGWQAVDAQGRVIAQANVLVLAAADASQALAGSDLTLDRVRGQVSELPAQSFSPPRVPVAGDGYVLPARDHICVVGATYEFDTAPDAVPRRAAHEENLDRLARLLGGQRARIDADAIDRLGGRVGWRAIAHDRMPVAGLLHDPAALESCRHGHMPRLDQLLRRPGLAVVAGLASRGIAWAGLGAALVTAQLCGDPLPVERALRDAVDPARFAWRRLKRGE